VVGRRARLLAPRAVGQASRPGCDRRNFNVATAGTPWRTRQAPPRLPPTEGSLERRGREGATARVLSFAATSLHYLPGRPGRSPAEHGGRRRNQQELT
jgi:hypothetical protein